MPSHGFSVRSPIAIALVVVVLHALALWVLQKSVLPVAGSFVQPPERLSARLVPPAATVQTAPAAGLTAKPVSPQPGPAARAAPLNALAKATQAAASPESAPVQMPAGAVAPAPATTAVGPVLLAQPVSTVQSTTSTASGGGIAAASMRVEPPSSSADYLQNLQPAYPPISRRLGEQGRVVVNVLIGVDGTAQKADITISSGFERLDQAALATVKSWRYVPGRRGGSPQEMWFAVPIQFVIE